MKDNKELELSNDEIAKAADNKAVTEDEFSTAIDKTGSYTDKELDDELERLAATFKQEYEKAQAMTEEELIKSGIIIQQFEDDGGVIPEEELCKCCGEQRRDKSFGENYEYCKNCRDAMKDYPFSIKSMAVLAVTVFLCVFSIISFVDEFDNYNLVRKGDNFVSERKLYSALEAYESAIDAFEEEEIAPEKLYLETAEILFNTMPNGIESMKEVAEKIEAAVSSAESKLPLYYKYNNMREEVLIMNGTFQEVYTLLNGEDYSKLDLEDDEDYKKIMTEIGSMIDKEVMVTAIDGSQKKCKANQASVRFCQYMFAYSVQRYDDCYKYMQEVAELTPDYLWIYAYELGNAKLQKGNADEAIALADSLYRLNAENVGSYVLYSTAYRMTSKPKTAVEWADKGLEIIPGDTELMRTKAMALIVQGEFEEAKKVVDEARELEDYGLLMLVSLVVENELGNKDEVKQVKKDLKEVSLEITERVDDYLDGKMTAKQLFTEGVGDVQ
ncbi:MAG: hypothetical protein E7529_04695 [Ruminococcaceae bacterium]|nr:hypothetical protein [Oscillospiraceae bacterium]